MREFFDRIVWRDHIWSLWQLGLSVVILTGAVYFYVDKNSSLADLVVRYESLLYSADESEAHEFILQESLGHYKDLIANGYVGEPQRLQWLESLRRLSDAYRIPDIEFTLEGTEITEQNVDPFWNPEVKMRATGMNIDMQLTHEGELYRLFSALKQRAAGMFSVENCRLRWLDTYGEDSALTRFRGICQLKWYTVVDGTADASALEETL